MPKKHHIIKHRMNWKQDHHTYQKTCKKPIPNVNKIPQKNLQNVDLYFFASPCIHFRTLWVNQLNVVWGPYPRINTWNLLRSKPEKNHPDSISSRLGKTLESKTTLDSVSLVDTAPRPEMPTTICCIQPIIITQTNIWHIIHSYILNNIFCPGYIQYEKKSRQTSLKHLKPSNRGTLRCTLVSP